MLFLFVTSLFVFSSVDYRFLTVSEFMNGEFPNLEVRLKYSHRVMLNYIMHIDLVIEIM